MSFQTKQFINKSKQHHIDNILNHKQSINLYNKNLIQKNVLPTDPTKRVWLIIYYNKFKTSNVIISNNTSLSTELLDRTNVLNMFKCPLGDCVFKENSAYIGLTTATLSRRLTMHLYDSSSITLHLKNDYKS